jgi:hypothetical protein
MKGYVDADTSIIIHENDPDLIPIRLSLPAPPDVKLIDGYGLPYKEQRFKRVEIPIKLQRLEKIVLSRLEQRKAQNKNFVITLYKIQTMFWEVLDKDRDSYKDEIEFIRRMWWHRLYGYWFYNRGKPTYITGWHFVYLNFWHMPDVRGGYPDYRDRDRKEFLFHQYAYTTTETFANLSSDGRAMKEDDGTYKMLDMLKRTCYGLGQPKNRRSGNTNKGLNNVLEIDTRTIGGDGGGIMSYTGNNAEAHFRNKLIPAWNKYPIFFKPTSTSGNNPQSLVFNVPDSEFRLSGLQNAITYASTSGAKFYDGQKLWATLLDEEGKTTEVDVDERWKVVVNCLSQGNGSIIHGYAYHPSTVEDYSSGGAAYKKLMEKSSFYQRVKVSGQTPSGLFRIFMPADEGLDGFIDSYGYSVRIQLLDYQREEGFVQTATEYLQGIRDYYTNLGTPESQVDFRTQQKLFPLQYSDCWLGEAGDIGFDLEIIDKGIARLQRKKATVTGNFEWVGGVFGSNVEWVADENGRFEISRLFEERANRRTSGSYFDFVDNLEKETWTPLDPTFATGGADPFKFKTSPEIKKSYQKHGMSDGGFIVLWEYDELLDGGKQRSEWDSDRIICTYRFRARTDDEYCEDILKACIWYGCMLYPEMNIPTVHKKFREWGYAGYLKHDVSADGVIKPEPGRHMLAGAKQEGFSFARDFISFRGHTIDHLDLLMECKNITAIEELTDYDLLASFLMCLIGSRSKYSKIVKMSSQNEVDISGILKQFKY